MKLETVAFLILTVMCPCGAFINPLHLNDMMRSMAATISLKPLATQFTNPYNGFTHSIRFSTRLYAVPTLDNWVINNKGEATGRV